MSDGRHPGRNIIIAGFHQSGKTTVGREVARRMRRPFVDIPLEQERRLNRLGYQLRFLGREPNPHEIEARLILDLSYRRETIIALGSDTFDNPDFYEELRIFSYIVVLDPPFNTIWERMQKLNKGEMKGLARDEALARWQAWRARLPKHELELTADGLSAAQAARLIAHCFYT